MFTESHILGKSNFKSIKKTKTRIWRHTSAQKSRIQTAWLSWGTVHPVRGGKQWITLLWRCFVLTNLTKHKSLRDTFRSLWTSGEKCKSNVHRAFLTRGSSLAGKNSRNLLISVQDLKVFCEQSRLSNAPGQQGCYYARFRDRAWSRSLPSRFKTSALR